MHTNRLCLRAVDFYPTRESAEAGEDSDGRTLEGYAAVFDTPTEINSFEGHFNETISKGAFKKTLSEKKMPVLQFDHGHDARTGSVPIGKFESLKEDKKGLQVKARLFDNPVVEPIRQAIEGEAISGMSFRFKVIRDEWKDNEGKRVRSDELGGLLYEPGKRGPLQRTIREVELFEAGPVVFPAYNATTVGVRSAISEDEKAELVRDYIRTMQVDALLEGGMTVEEVARTFAEEYERADDPKKPYGDVTYADPGYQADGKKRYPIDTADHVKAAWSYINQGGNASKYSSDQVAKIKGRIKSAAKKFGIEISNGDGGEKSSEPLSDETILPADDAAQAGTSSMSGETPEDAAPFAGTSAGDRSKVLREMRLKQLRSKAIQ